MNIQLFLLVLSFLGVSLCSEPTDNSSIDESNISSQVKRINISQRLLGKNLTHRSKRGLNRPLIGSDILSQEKHTKICNAVSSHRYYITPPLSTLSVENRDGLTRDFRITYQEMKAIYPNPYFEICKDDSLNQRFIELSDSFSLRINNLFDNLEKQIPVLKSLLETFGVCNDFWIFFWVTHCQSDFESGFPAYQTLLFKDQEFSCSFEIKTGLILDQIILKIRSLIEKLDALSFKIFSTISGLKWQLKLFEEFQNRFPFPSFYF
jgi:hypothetical protein